MHAFNPDTEKADMGICEFKPNLILHRETWFKEPGKRILPLQTMDQYSGCRDLPTAYTSLCFLSLVVQMPLKLYSAQVERICKYSY